jgi:ankyrin repeat protein
MSSLKEAVNERPPNWNEIETLIESNPTSIEQEIDENGYLLHYACWGTAPSDFSIKLIQDYPQACQIKGDDGWFPLHWACFSNQSESVIQ